MVSFTRKVDPLRVPELVAHEVEIPLARGGQSCESNHFVQGDTALDRKVFAMDRHAVVHARPNEAEDERLVPDQGLVVRLRVTDGPFVAAAVGQLVP